MPITLTDAPTAPQVQSNLAKLGYSQPTAITPSNLAPVTPVTLPQPGTPTPTPTVTATDYTNPGATGDPSSDLFKQMLSLRETAPSIADQYTQLKNQSDVAQKQQLANTYKAKLEDSQRRQVNEIEKLNKIEGITSAGKSSMEADINRKFYREQADLAIQQSAYQNDYTSAQNELDKLFGYTVQDSTNRVNEKNKTIDAIYSFMTEQQKTKAQELKDTRSTNLNQINNALNYTQSLSGALIKTNPALSSRLINLQTPDPASKTFTEDLKNYNNQVALIAGQAPVDPANAPGAGNFTPTQTNDGAVRAGMDIAEFKNLPVDVRNFFSQNSNTSSNLTSITKEIQAVADGDKTAKDASTAIDKLNISNTVKTYFKSVASAREKDALAKSKVVWWNPLTWGK